MLTHIYTLTQTAATPCTAQAGSSTDARRGQARQEVTLHLRLMMELLVYVRGV